MDDSKKSREQLIAELQALRQEVQLLRGDDTLPSQHDFLLHVLDSLDTPVFVKDEALNWVYLNDAACNILNQTKAELIGKCDLDVYPKDHADYIRKWDRQVLNSGETVTYERVTPLPGGGHHYVTLKSRYIDPATQKPYVVGVLQDITHLRLMQSELVAAQDRMQTILNAPGVGILVTRDNKILFVNQTICEAGGYTISELISKPLSNFVHPDEREETAKNNVGRLQGEDVPSHYLHRILKKDGTAVWVGNSSQVIDWQDGPANLHFLVDMNSLKKAQDDLAMREQWIRQIIDLVPHFIYARHEDGRFLLANEALAEAYGTTVEKLVNTPDHPAFALHEALDPVDQAVLQKKTTCNVESLTLTDASGEERVLECTTIPFISQDKDSSAVLGVCNDTTRAEIIRTRLERLNSCLLNFGSEPEANIQQLVGLCGEILLGACALYNRIEGDLLTSIGAWNPPPDFKFQDAAAGHICSAIVAAPHEGPALIRNLQHTEYAKTDPNVTTYGLETYLGIPVRTGAKRVGSLCVVYTQDFTPTPEDNWLLGVIASAIAVEERRFAALESIRSNAKSLRAMFDATDAQLLLADEHGTILTANAEAAAAAHRSVEQCKGLNLTSIMPLNQAADRLEAIQQATKTGGAVHYSQVYDHRQYEHSVYPIATDSDTTHYAFYTKDQTQKKRAERRLRESEERFRTTFEQAAVGMAHVTPDGRFIRVNSKLCDILGFTKDELQSTQVLDLTHPQDVQEELRQTQKLERGLIPSFSMEKRFIRKDTTHCWVNFTASCIVDSDNAPKYFSCVIQDISLRKGIEATLLRRDAVLESVGHAAERFLQAGDWTEHIMEVLESLCTAAMVSRAYIFQNKRTDEGILYATQLFEWNAPGISPEIENPELQRLFYDEYGLHQLKTTLSHKQPYYNCVDALPAPDRAILEPQGILSLAVVPIFSEGRWWGFMGFDDCLHQREWMASEIEALVAAADIIGNAIAHKRIDKALKDSERKFRIIAEAVEDVLWISTPDRQQLLYVSPAFEKLGGPRNKLLGKPESFWEVVHPQDRRKILKTYLRPSKKVREIEYRIKDDEEGWLWIRERAFPVFSNDGELEWLAGVSSDVTPTRKTAEEIHRSLREKELLLQEVHHRVKNNLQIITSLLDMAGRRISDPHAKDIMRDTQSKIHSMAMIHLQLYGHERFDRIDMANYARLLTWQLAQMYNADNVTPKFDLQNINLPLSQAIPCGLVLSEALANAFKHAFPPDQNGTLDLCIKKLHNNDIMIRIADNGSGFIDNTNRDDDSVGMKLLTNIVQFQLNGSLDITSDNGTTLTVQFPLEEQGAT